MAAPAHLVERIGGRSFTAGAHRSFPLDDPDRVHLVDRGHLDIFAAEFRGAEVIDRRPFATRIPAGAVAFGAPRAVLGDRVFGFLAVPSRDAVIVAGKRSGLAAEGVLDVGVVSWIDDWVSRLAELLVRRAGPVPRDAVLLEADPDVPYPAQATLSAHHRDVVWVTADRPVRLLGSAELPIAAGDVVPLCERTWVRTGDERTRVSAVHTPGALVSGTLWPALDRFGTLLLFHSGTLRREGAEALEERHRGVREAHDAASRDAQRNLEFVLQTSAGTPDAPAGRTPAEAVMQVLGASAGVEIRALPPLHPSGGETETGDPLETYLAVARGSAARARRITLAPGWWKRDGPSFAGTTGPDDRPIAVLKDGRRGFRAVDPAAERSFRVGRRQARDIASEAVMLYAPFPDRVRSVMAALGEVAGSVSGEIRTVLLMSLLGALVGLATPVLTGHLLATVIPRSDTPMWMAGLAAMFLCAVGRAVFQLVQAFALLRIQGRLDERLHGALWSRVLSLPAGFFRRYAAGDLADRLGGLTAIRGDAVRRRAELRGERPVLAFQRSGAAVLQPAPRGRRRRHGAGPGRRQSAPRPPADAAPARGPEAGGRHRRDDLPDDHGPVDAARRQCRAVRARTVGRTLRPATARDVPGAPLGGGPARLQRPVHPPGADGAARRDLGVSRRRRGVLVRARGVPDCLHRLRPACRRHDRAHRRRHDADRRGPALRTRGAVARSRARGGRRARRPRRPGRRHRAARRALPVPARQRLRARRGVPPHPARRLILLFDEATSALDNQTQAIVQESLRRLSITRIVIAHRLSTVRDVDRIYVLDQGRIAESGSYDELIARGGAFAELAKRQLV